MSIRRERISKQLGRVLVIMEALRYFEEASTQSIVKVVNNHLELKVCERTVWRDLATLREYGFIVSRKANRAGGGVVLMHQSSNPVKIKKLCEQANQGRKST